MKGLFVINLCLNELGNKKNTTIPKKKDKIIIRRIKSLIGKIGIRGLKNILIAKKSPDNKLQLNTIHLILIKEQFIFFII